MRAVAALLAVALAAPATAARAQATTAAELVGSFRALCEATGAHSAAVLAAADTAGGWSPLPDSLMAGMAGQFQNAAGRLKSSSTGFQFMMVGEQTRTIAGRELKMRACAVGAATPEAAQVEALLDRVAGVPRDPVLSAAPRVGWAYAEQAGAHRPMSLADKPAVDAALAAGQLRMLFKQTQPASVAPSGVTLVVYAVPANAGG